MRLIKRPCLNCDEWRINYTEGICERCFKTLRLLNAPMIKCQCSQECKTMIPSITFDGKPRTFKKGHEMKGNKHYNWGKSVLEFVK